MLLLGPALHLPQNLYTSPLQAVGGPGPEFFTVTLYSIDPDGATRWRLFTPWGPALGFIANIYLVQPAVLYLFGLACSTAGMAAPALIQWRADAEAKFKGARAASSRVRETLGNIAVQRWESEAPIWGHGIVERGPHLVEYMPIGSHHSWYGLLFVKGMVGFAALACPWPGVLWKCC